MSTTLSTNYCYIYYRHVYTQDTIQDLWLRVYFIIPPLAHRNPSLAHHLWYNIALYVTISYVFYVVTLMRLTDSLPTLGYNDIVTLLRLCYTITCGNRRLENPVSFGADWTARQRHGDTYLIPRIKYVPSNVVCCEHDTAKDLRKFKAAKTIRVWIYNTLAKPPHPASALRIILKQEILPVMCHTVCFCLTFLCYGRVTTCV